MTADKPLTTATGSHNAMQAVCLGTPLPPVTIGATSQQSGPIGSNLCRVIATTACHIAFGPSPVATTNSTYLAPDTPEYFVCAESDKIAVIQSASGGKLYITTVV